MLASKLLGERQIHGAHQQHGGQTTTTTATRHLDASAAAAGGGAAGAPSEEQAAAVDRSHGRTDNSAPEDRTPGRGGVEVGGPAAAEAGVSAGAAAGTTGVSGGEEEAAGEAVRIVAVDLQEMAPIEGVKQLQVTDRYIDRKCRKSAGPDPTNDP